jgi:protein-disulfide isomerase
VWYGVIGLTIGGAGGFYGGQEYLRSQLRSKQRPKMAPAYVAIADWNPTLGPKHAKVTVVEFSDFQ